LRIYFLESRGIAMKVPLLDLKAQYAGLRDDIRRAIDKLCDSQSFILGPTVEAFERRVAEYCGTAHAVGMSSGTDALLAALMALDVGAGDGVVTTSYSFFATAGCIARLGATPLLADIDPVTFNIDPESARRLLREAPRRHPGIRPKALLPVHLYGQVAAMDELMAVAAENGLKVVEDACQAIGAEYPGRAGCRRAGAIGDMGCFSFFPSKNLGGFGDGGMVTTNSAELSERLRVLRNHGAQPKYYHKLIGGNFRLDALQAAVLDVKLNHLEAWHEARRRNAGRYDALFRGTAVATPKAVYDGRGVRNYHIYNQYVVRVSNRDAAIERLRSAGIGCEVYYPVPLHLQECFRELGYGAGDLPHSEKAARETLALPVYPEMTEDMIETVASALTAACDRP
jgi:dTDP-4-amino-4,6-dideoxygalactose transaminase